MEGLEQKLIDLITKAEAAGATVAPQAYDALLRAVQTEAAISLSMGGFTGLLFVGAVLSLLACVKNVGRIDALPNNEQSATEIGMWIAVGAASAIAGIISLLTSTTLLFNSKTWLALVDPVAYIAAKVLL